MLSLVQAASVFLLATQSAVAYNFPFEAIQLTDADVKSNSDIAFGQAVTSIDKNRCKTYVGDAKWPTTARWNAFNTSLGGALLKGIPPAAACYAGPYFDTDKCAYVQANYMSTNLVTADPTIPNGQWQLNNPCPVPLNISAPVYSCNISAFPAYVVNVTSVKQIQAAVNFARNYNIRVTIKNTGHDWLGRNTGSGGLQIWTHHLKALEFLPSYTFGKYSGKAAKVGSALEQFELHQYMTQYNMTLLAPGSTTVGAYGGFMQGGGFSTMISSKYGLMADQVLSFEVITADGQFIHVDPNTNEDLFWAIRGGGGGNFGIVTSAIVKAYDTIPIAQGLINFQTYPLLPGVNNSAVVTNEVFWKGVNTYFSWLPNVTDLGGVGWNLVNTIAPNGTTPRLYSFVGQYNFGGFQKDEAIKFLIPVVKDLNAVGVNVTGPFVDWFATYPLEAYRPTGPGETVMTSRFGSRLFPRENLVDPTSDKFNKTMASIRAFSEEGGYNFHSVDFTPTKKIAGWPGSDSAVNPHLRTAIIHATGYDTNSYGPEVPREQQIKNHARLDSYVQKWRDASPTSGAYMNEVDTQEPNFKESLYGDNYAPLLKIKKAVDPYFLFYAVTMVGSDEWYIEGADGLPTQAGRLCRVNDTSKEY